MNVIWIICVIVIFTIVSFIVPLFLKSKNITNENILEESLVIKPNKIFMILSLIGVILFPILIALCFIFPADINYKFWWLVVIVFLILYSLPIYLLIFSLNFKIILYKDYFIYQNFWKLKRTVLYKDIKIDKTKLYPRVMKKTKGNKHKTIFKLAGILDNEIHFLDFYKNWKNK